MSKKKPFDAAIAVLKTELRECSPDEEDEFCDFIQSLTDNQYEKGLRIAIRVLEAAGKIVDRRNEVLECLNAITPSNDGRINYIYNSVRGLLESLPEKEK